MLSSSSLHPGGRCLATLALALPLLVCAHGDLELQIEALTERIESEPDNAALYFQRGNLYRRLQQWEPGARDYLRARELEPDNPDIDRHEGLLWVDAGRYRVALDLLDRYLRFRPGDTTALQARARAHLGLDAPLEAAGDLARAIAASDSPGPALFSARVIALLAAGEAHHDAAAIAAQSGLELFPNEITLLGLAVDLALARLDTSTAGLHLGTLPGSLAALPQWRYRTALTACLDGRVGPAAQAFERLRDDLASGRTRTGTWSVPAGLVERLAAKPGRDACSKATQRSLDRYREDGGSDWQIEPEVPAGTGH